ncbi:hypothetical protein ACE193_17965 [Bernardetia sp. OM2101]|uniref:hypothetical protein n=1 Tax=Bernardetia sp. OM2101 TaxID=3344876 RepID=UPI0035CED7C8
MTLKKTFTLSLLFISSLLLLSSCIKEGADRKKELNEILTIARSFKHTKAIQSEELNKYTGRYNINYDSLYPFNRNAVCVSCREKELNKIISEVEGIENISSKLYLTEFVKMVYYEKEKDYLTVVFYKFPFLEKNTKGIKWQDGRWREYVYMAESGEVIYQE